MPLLAIPTDEDVNRITKAFLLDLQSFTVTDETTKEIKPVICSVCDSIPTESQWSTFVDLDEFVRLCTRSKMLKDDSVKAYGTALRNQYTAKEPKLAEFILSPETHVTSNDEVLVCKQCLSELRANSKKKPVRC